MSGLRIPGYPYTPLALRGWWGGEDRRPRCTQCQRVAFEDGPAAERSAEKIRLRTEASRRPAPNMKAYRGRCGQWHVGQRRNR